MIRLIKATMVNTTAQVRVNSYLTEIFQVKCGLKQGDGLAPILFNLTLEYVVRKLPIDTNSTLFYKSSQLVGYAEDIHILGSPLPAINEIYTSLENETKLIGIIISADKTKVLIQSVRNINHIAILNNTKIENLDTIVFLGSALSKSNDEMLKSGK